MQHRRREIQFAVGEGIGAVHADGKIEGVTKLRPPTSDARDNQRGAGLANIFNRELTSHG